MNPLPRGPHCALLCPVGSDLFVTKPEEEPDSHANWSLERLMVSLMELNAAVIGDGG